MKAYEIVTDRILGLLTRGVIPWRQGWKTALPKSLGSKKGYRGINILLLSCTGFSSKYWTTYKEAIRLGGNVKRGEKSTPVIYWHWRTKEEIQKLIASGKANDPAPCIPFVSHVFNLDQTEGLERPEDDCKVCSDDNRSVALQVYTSMQSRPMLEHGVQLNPSYCVQDDTVRLPFVSQFENADLYYVNLFHELIHSTGHTSRLDRLKSHNGGRAGSLIYSFEELVAEFGAAFLCSMTSIDNTRVVEDSASYIAEWSAVFRGDKTMLLKAASAAQRAVDYVTGVDFAAVKQHTGESIAA